VASRVSAIADVVPVVYYLRADKLWSRTLDTVSGQIGDATEIRANNGTIKAFDVDYHRRLVYWIDSQNKVPLFSYVF